MAWDDEDEIEADDSGMSGAAALSEWVREHYEGDERIEAVDSLDPGPLDGELLRVRLMLNPETYFFVSVLEDDLVVRVGLATEDKELSEEIDETATSQAGSLTEFLQQAIDTDEELEYEATHFHDDVYYFSSEIPYTRETDLASRHMRENVALYLEGYINAILSLIEEAGSEDEDDDE